MTCLATALLGLVSHSDEPLIQPEFMGCFWPWQSVNTALADVENRLSEVVDSIEREHGRVVVTNHGRPAAVVINVDDLESLDETLEILSNPELMAAIRAGEDDVAERRTEQLSRDHILARVIRK